MKSYSLIFLCLLVLGGCVPKQTGAFDGISQTYPDAARELAADAARHLASALPPGQTALAVAATSPFGMSFEEALRRKGFMLNPDGLAVHYSVDLIDGHGATAPVCYLHVKLADGSGFSQVYNLQGGTAAPGGDLVKTGLPDYVPEPITPLPSDPPAPVVTEALRELAPGNKDLQEKKEILAEAPELQPRPVISSGRLSTPEGKRFGQGENAAPSASAIPEPASKASQLVDVPAALEPEPESEALPPAVPPYPAPVELSTASLNRWTIVPGMLREQLESWTAQAGYQLVWKARYDYEIQSQAVFQNDFVGAVQRLFASMHRHGNPLRATVYQNNKVLEILGE